MLVMGFFLLQGEPATDQTLVEIVDQVMLPLVQVSATEPHAVVNAATARRVRVT
jgi:hypothetical protein